MSPLQATIVRQSHVRLLARRAELSATFRVNLLRIDPSLRSLVVTDDGQHDFQPVMWLEAVVSLLRTPALLLRSLHELGRRMNQQVTALQISNIVRASLQSLRTCLGDHWDAETERAWGALHQLLQMNILSALVARAQHDELEAMAA